jgi:NADH-quinone oxidoreductase subunit L
VPHILEPLFAEAAENQGLAWLSAGVGILGILLAILFYVIKPGLADSVAKSFGGLYTLVYNKYFVDEAYDAAVVQPLVEGSRTVLWRGIDAGLIDGTVNGVGRRSRGIGSILRLVQSGNIRSYAAWVVLGSIALLIAIGFAGVRL